jgi:hypothetical protein
MVLLLLFGGYPGQKSARNLAIMTEHTSYFFLIAFKHVVIVPKVGLDRFIPLHFQFITQ